MIHDSYNRSWPLARAAGFWFEELTVGDAWRSGGYTVTDAAIIGFAAEWDWQPFHVDAEAAAGSIFGTLVGSGLQTLLLSYRLYHSLKLLDGTAIAGLGIDKIRFLAPLKPGDTISVLVRVATLRQTSRADRGIVTFRFETSDQRSSTLMTLSLTALVACGRQGDEGAAR